MIKIDYTYEKLTAEGHTPASGEMVTLARSKRSDGSRTGDMNFIAHYNEN